MKILLIFCFGLIILAGAIFLNFLASKFGFTSWYEFLKGEGKRNIISYLWLFLFYPLGLGIIAYFATKLFNF